MLKIKAGTAAFATGAVAGALLLVTAIGPAMAGPMITFSASVGTQPTGVGTITLTQNGANAVDVTLDLLPDYGIINSGGPHTPFAFNLSGSGTLSISSFTTPAGGAYGADMFSLNTGGGDNNPYGSYGVAIDSTAGMGSSSGYFGDLQFTLSRTGGLDTTDFVANADGYYFSADLSDRTNTGAQAWSAPVQLLTRTATTPVPEPGTVALLGVGLLGLGCAHRRKARAAA